MSLRLVSSFSEKAYPYERQIPIWDHGNPAERKHAYERLQTAVNITGISDYHLAETTTSVTLYMSDENDKDAINLALQPEGPGYKIIHPLITFDLDTDFRRVKRQRNYLEKLADDTGFGKGVIKFDADRKERKISLVTASKQAFFNFWYTPEFQDVMHHYYATKPAQLAASL